MWMDVLDGLNRCLMWLSARFGTRGLVHSQQMNQINEQQQEQQQFKSYNEFKGTAQKELEGKNDLMSETRREHDRHFLRGREGGKSTNLRYLPPR